MGWWWIPASLVNLFLFPSSWTVGIATRELWFFFWLFLKYHLRALRSTVEYSIYPGAAGEVSQWICFICRHLCKFCARCVFGPYKNPGGSAELTHAPKSLLPASCKTLEKQHFPSCCDTSANALEHPSDEAESCQGINAEPARKQAL